ncbi:hypothetical protein ON010_g1531 [Phytophthora cinnamomi]|nr:hypothetical protein ON010_g1531 [Phytophthora cinnamomi]
MQDLTSKRSAERAYGQAPLLLVGMATSTNRASPSRVHPGAPRTSLHPSTVSLDRPASTCNQQLESQLACAPATDALPPFDWLPTAQQPVGRVAGQDRLHGAATWRRARTDRARPPERSGGDDHGLIVARVRSGHSLGLRPLDRPRGDGAHLLRGGADGGLGRRGRLPQLRRGLLHDRAGHLDSHPRAGEVPGVHDGVLVVVPGGARVHLGPPRRSLAVAVAGAAPLEATAHRAVRLNGRVRVASVGDVELRFVLDSGSLCIRGGCGLGERVHLVMVDRVEGLYRGERGDGGEDEGEEVHCGRANELSGLQFSIIFTVPGARAPQPRKFSPAAAPQSDRRPLPRLDFQIRRLERMSDKLLSIASLARNQVAEATRWRSASNDRYLRLRLALLALGLHAKHGRAVGSRRDQHEHGERSGEEPHAAFGGRKAENKAAALSTLPGDQGREDSWRRSRGRAARSRRTQLAATAGRAKVAEGMAAAGNGTAEDEAEDEAEDAELA